MGIQQKPVVVVKLKPLSDITTEPYPNECWIALPKPAVDPCVMHAKSCSLDKLDNRL